MQILSTLSLNITDREKTMKTSIEVNGRYILKSWNNKFSNTSSLNGLIIKAVRTTVQFRTEGMFYDFLHFSLFILIDFYDVLYLFYAFNVYEYTSPLFDGVSSCGKSD